MNKRLLAGLMALCLAAGAANAAFAEGPLSLKAPIHTESIAPATGETAAPPRAHRHARNRRDPGPASGHADQRGTGR